MTATYFWQRFPVDYLQVTRQMNVFQTSLFLHIYLFHSGFGLSPKNGRPPSPRGHLPGDAVRRPLAPWRRQQVDAGLGGCGLGGWGHRQKARRLSLTSVGERPLLESDILGLE